MAEIAQGRSAQPGAGDLLRSIQFRRRARPLPPGCGRSCWTSQLLNTMSLLGVLSKTARDHRANTVVDRRCSMQLHLVPKSIKLAPSEKMTARWAAVRVDPRIAPSGG
jgi:hypothetical protein